MIYIATEPPQLVNTPSPHATPRHLRGGYRPEGPPVDEGTCRGANSVNGTVARTLVAAIFFPTFFLVMIWGKEGKKLVVPGGAEYFHFDRKEGLPRGKKGETPLLFLYPCWFAQL